MLSLGMQCTCTWHAVAKLACLPCLSAMQAVEWVSQRTQFLSAVTATLLPLLGAATLYAPLYGPDASATTTWPPERARTYIALWSYGSLLASAALAGLILCLILRANWLAAATSRWLSSPVLSWAGGLSYHTYLLHMLAIYWAEQYLLPLGWLASFVAQAPRAGFLLMLTGAYAAATAVSVAHRWLHAHVINPWLSGPW